MQRIDALAPDEFADWALKAAPLAVGDALWVLWQEGRPVLIFDEALWEALQTAGAALMVRALMVQAWQAVPRAKWRPITIPTPREWRTVQRQAYRRGRRIWPWTR